MPRDIDGNRYSVFNPPRWVLVLVVMIASSISIVSGIGIYTSTNHNSVATEHLAVEIKDLLTSGHTQTAVRVRKLSREIDTLIGNQHGNRIILNDVLYLVRYVRVSQGQSSQVVNRIVHQIETHIDATIARDLSQMMHSMHR